MHDLHIRRANPDDAAAIAEIYNHYITTSTATFDTAPKSVEDRTDWLAERGPKHPVFVAEEAGTVVGWGALSKHAARPAWSLTAEVAVYLAPDCTGRGVGPRILAHLVEAARAAGHHALVTQIVSENAASLAMTSRAGFAEVGTLREVGRKFDRWLDVVIMELVLEANEA